MVEIVKGDIVIQEIEAIVNAANNSLLGGAGVDGAIHSVAGKELLAECKTIGFCKTGQAVLTKAYKLKSDFVIHTVGPIWYGGGNNEEHLLSLCYRNVFNIIREKNIKSVAFPAISTGVYKFPVDLATDIALRETREFLKSNINNVKIVFVCYDENTYNVYLNKFNQLFRKG
ncbi:MAG: macro domain-containing protein [Candidatus Cloacimonetes bacterium]|jgi:O-acetyl-ADP-ribose deacetylase (regulator of RNase III)|nr:macro domain-containing protein [Candidatus Cloacimonadota bacterium]